MIVRYKNYCNLIIGFITAWAGQWGCANVSVNDAEVNPCQGVECSGHGECVLVQESQAACACDEGYNAKGYECLPDEPADTATDSDSDADSDTDIGADADTDSDTDTDADSDTDTDTDSDTDTDTDTAPGADSDADSDTDSDTDTDMDTDSDSDTDTDTDTDTDADSDTDTDADSDTFTDTEVACGTYDIVTSGPCDGYSGSTYGELNVDINGVAHTFCMVDEEGWWVTADYQNKPGDSGSAGDIKILLSVPVDDMTYEYTDPTIGYTYTEADCSGGTCDYTSDFMFYMYLYGSGGERLDPVDFEYTFSQWGSQAGDDIAGTLSGTVSGDPCSLTLSNGSFTTTQYGI